MSKGVKWDENNLETNEQNRTATMKIDEPPTPFNFEYCDDEVDEEEKKPQGKGAAELSTGSDAGKSKPGALSFAEQWEKAGMQEVDPESLGKPAFESAPLTPEEEAEVKRKFEENRKKHYSMKEALAMKAPVYDDEEEDEDSHQGGEELDSEAKEQKRQEFAKKRKAFYQEKDREAAERSRKEKGENDSDSGTES